MNLRDHHFPAVPMPVPYGAHLVDKGVHFTICSRRATRVWLMLFDAPDADKPIEEYELTPENNRIGDIWHSHIPHARNGMYYLYRMEGQPFNGEQNFFDPEQWLLDPYALAISGSDKWGAREGYTPGHPVKNGPYFPKGLILKDDFDWSEDRTLRTPLNESIIYETHLRGFTVHTSSKVKYRGTYRGFIEKIPYLKDLGITAVELLPIQEFNEMEYYLENMGRRHLHNYWGYSTLSFFAPNGRYAASGIYGQQVHEFKEMVIELHKAGIELIMDVVFNHTTEGGDQGPTYSFRGIDNPTYYMMSEDGNHYMNYSGCGNTVNSNHPVVRDFIIDCLRYWVLNMHVDGFRFDLASVMTRGPDGEVLPNPPIVEHIAEDPALRDTKIIAEAWDAAGAYQVGSFPNERWSEWNGRFRDDVRRFWIKDKGMLGSLATRLTGSADLYLRKNQTPQKSINFITCHDGFTLQDLVSFVEKHNEDNAEENRDGDNHNISCNYGKEGLRVGPKIKAMRLKHQKNLLTTLFLSQGVPMLLGGDEFGRTQQGNNNAYCQDSIISWFDWSLLKKNNDLHAFTKQLITFRKQHPCLRRKTFFTGDANGNRASDIAWFGPNGKDIDWENGQSLGCVIDGHKENTGAEADGDSLCLLFNASDKPAIFVMPTAPGTPWKLELTTQTEPLQWKNRKKFIGIDALSVAVFSSAP